MDSGEIGRRHEGKGGLRGGLCGGAGRPGFRMGGGGGVTGKVPRGGGESLSIVAE